MAWEGLWHTPDKERRSEELLSSLPLSIAVFIASQPGTGEQLRQPEAGGALLVTSQVCRLRRGQGVHLLPSWLQKHGLVRCL